MPRTRLGTIAGRAALYSSAAVGAFFLLHTAAASADEQRESSPRGPLSGAVQTVGESVSESVGKTLGKSATAEPRPRPASDQKPTAEDQSGSTSDGPSSALKPLTNENGDIGIGDARPSTPASQKPDPGEKNPPFNRSDATVIPRVGVGYNVETATIRWTYDFRSPVDTNVLTSAIPLPKPKVQRILPGDFGVVQNHASHLVEDNRTADGPRYPTDPNNADWNLTTTDVLVPGAGRALRFDMVCPNHSGWSDDHGSGHGGGSDSQHGDHFDGVYTGASKYSLRDSHLVFSYQWGDKLVNNAFIEAHYLAYGLSNDS